MTHPVSQSNAKVEPAMVSLQSTTNFQGHGQKTQIQPASGSATALPPSNVTSKSRLIVIALLSLVSGVSLSIWLDSQGKKQFTGLLDARPYQLQADDLFLVSQLHKQSGQMIAKGETVITLVNEQIGHELETLKSRIESLTAECDQLQAAADLEIVSAKRAIDNQIYTTQMQLAQYQQAVYSAEVTAMAWEQVLSRDKKQEFAENSLTLVPETMTENWLSLGPPQHETILTMLKYASSVNSLEVSQTQVSLCENRLSELDSEMAVARDLIYRSRGLTPKREQLASLIHREAELTQNRHQLTLRSPVHGLVGDYHVHAHQMTSPGQDLVAIYDLDQLYLDARIDTNQIGHFATGQRVELVFPGEFKATGLVEEIARKAEHAGAAKSLPVSQTYVLVRIVPHGARWPEVPLGSVVKIQL